MSPSPTSSHRMAHYYRGKHNWPSRRFGERAIDLALLGGFVASVSHALGLLGKLSVTRHEFTLPPERRLHKPLRIAFASDFHAGPTTHPALFRDLFHAIAQEKPDLLLLGGDFVSCKAEYAEAFTGYLTACRPALGKFAVFGNHDLWVDDRKLTNMFERAGVSLLINRNLRLPAPFDAVSLCGIDDPWTGEPDADAAFHEAQPTRIFLTHAPDGLLFTKDKRFDLAFAGHTHGGQIVPLSGKPMVLPHGPLSRSYPYGRFDLEQQAALIVSRGVGCSTLPLRINADPELVICALS
ncbi:MAG TPA: metallophosphoesterase [Burkholderiaceae bacterium]